MSTHHSPFIRAIRGANPLLWPTRLRLLQLKAAYKAHAYSGHPDGMLDSIDHQESKLQRYKEAIHPFGQTEDVAHAAAVEPADVPAPFERSFSMTGRREFDELTARSHRNGGPFEPGLEAAQRRLDHMQYLYRTGGYMGHPEELLEDIEAEENRIRLLEADTSV